jgi:hypothetical protein
MKEREENGCSNLFSINRQCIDDESVYLKGTKLEESDNNYDKLRDKLISILSYHEKGGVWKR